MSSNTWGGITQLKADLDAKAGALVDFGLIRGQILAAHLFCRDSWCSGPCPGQGCWKSWRVYLLTLGTSPRRCSDSLCSSISVARVGTCHLGATGASGLIVGICKKTIKSR